MLSFGEKIGKSIQLILREFVSEKSLKILIKKEKKKKN